MSDFIIGILAIALGIAIMVALPLVKTITVHPITALPLILIGFLLVNSYFSVVGEHLKLISKDFLKNMSPDQRLDIISSTVIYCMEQKYSEWWKLQKAQGLNSEHVSLGIYIAIIGGVVEKNDIIKYSKHLNDCHICQDYMRRWKIDLLQKIKKRD